MSASSLSASSKMRRAFDSVPEKTADDKAPSGIAPLLKSLMEEYAATGLPPAYLPKGDNNE